MKTLIAIFIIVGTHIANAQSRSSNFIAHENLIGGVWKVDTQWEDGTPHRLFVAYESSLDGAILKSRTHGNVSNTGFEFGLRNEGIRYYDKQKSIVKFHEYDVFGGLTQGEVRYRGKDIYYTYEYLMGEQKTRLTDGWEYLDVNTYRYIVGIFNFEKNEWEKKFLNAQIKRSKNE